MVFPHQQSAYESLLETADIFFGGAWRALPVRPRFSRLVVGPSGVGKSHLVRAVAAQFDLPVLALDSTNWIPLGVSDRGARQTWVDIAAFLREHAHGLIFLDEIDKIGRSDSPANCPWLHFLRVEMFSLLDRRVPENLLMASEEMSKSDMELVRVRLKTATMLVGAGAFQEFWDAQGKPSVGFGSGGREESAMLDHAKVSQFVATEIINRFEAPVLALRAMGIDDYRDILARLVGKMPGALGRDVAQIGNARLHEAAASHLGVRWLEEVVYRALAKRRKSKKSGASAPRKETRELFELAENQC